MPAPGKNNRVSLNTAKIHNQSAVGLSIVGIVGKDNGDFWDYSLGIASSNDDTMSKFSLGFSF
jgi:hypothetical protein